MAQATRREVIVVDGTKVSPRLGSHFSLPVEVLPFGWSTQLPFLSELGAEVERREDTHGEAYRTDGGNFILDCTFGPIKDPRSLAEELSRRAGVIEHGLFLNLAHDLIVADAEGIRHQKAS